MNTPELKSAISAAMALFEKNADELRDLDAALGDGDLGITAASGAQAVIAALATLDDDLTPSDVAKACAKAFANANPSTMAALVAGALLAGSKVWIGTTEVTLAEGIDFTQAGINSISTRGKSAQGDKTILDAMIPAVEALRAADDARSGLDAAIVGAAKGVAETKEMQSRRGRASWLQERSIGLQDPGATAFLRFLEAWRDAVK